MIDVITIKGAREHNLKDIDLELPKNKLIVFTGVSGSGKSSLAFDTIFAEGQRRYVESLSSYARQFLGLMEKPDVDYIEGLSPAISIDQKSASHNPRSTVGTVTEIYDYLRLLYAKIGIPHCLKCDKPIRSSTIEEMVDTITNWPEGNTVQVFAPVVRGKKGEYSTVLEEFHKKGFTKARVNGKIVELSSHPKLARYKTHNIEIYIDEIVINAENLLRITEATENAVKLTDGVVLFINKTTKEEKQFNIHFMCPDCEEGFPELEPRLFSFNSPFGACPTCNGLGYKREIDTALIIPDKSKTISEGAVLPYSYKPNNFYGTILRAVCRELDIPDNKRLSNWTSDELDYLIYGIGGSDRLRINYFSSGQMNSFTVRFGGVIKYLERRYQQTESPAVRADIEKYMSILPCPSCHGARLKPEALAVKIGKYNINDIVRYPVIESKKIFEKMSLNERELLIGKKILKEIRNRLDFLINVGLGYLTLDRQAFSLSGGEAQRIRLASQLGSALTGVLYVLDEPSIGLHARDHHKLLDILKKLRDLGNTIIVVEHDEETIRSGDWIVDIGPRAGIHGGKIVAEGTLDKILKSDESITSQYLNKKKQIEIPEKRRDDDGKFISVTGAREHNLKNITVHFPVGLMTCVTGVSGSGKSTLVNEILYKALSKKINGTLEKPGKYNDLKGHENIQRIIDIDQSPIGRTPRSNPATYTGVFTPIRELFAKTKEAKLRGYQPGRFSFNVFGGRCEACKGEGFNQIHMQFLPDVYVPCDVCKSKRYNKETLKVTYKDKNIAEVLKMTVDEALGFFGPIPKIRETMEVLQKVGLGYIELGQSATTLSGGEAQRIKLASELSKKQHGRNLYILDEPTTGLHFADIAKLIETLQELVKAGNTIIIIEHNMDVIKICDHIIDLGPEGGDAGGEVIAVGTPEQVANNEKSFTGEYLKKVLK